ncbi:MAG: sulfite exporter TauE/SafE family protein [Pseudomonadota bacterium]|nr:sulfite exporter TauE/SafE family protein [Pseudomonadota bacterium]
MNALAGGGSFVTLPALIASGVPSVTANTTSAVALFPGQITSAWTYRDGLGPIGPVSLRSLVIATFVGGAIGALLLLRTPVSTFDVILPWLLAVATIALAFGGQLGESLRHRWPVSTALVLAVQFGLGVYGGYFGGGVGFMMMAVWSLIADRTLKSFNAPRTLMVCAANAVAVIIFLAARAVVWHQALAILVGAIAGGFFGSHIGRRAPAKIVRVGTLALSVLITLLFFAKAYVW